METVALIRDIVIILLGLFNLVLLGVAIAIGVVIYKLVRVGGREFPRIMETVEQTLHTVQGTTEFIGATVAKPAIGATSRAATVRQFVRVFFGLRRRSGGV